MPLSTLTGIMPDPDGNIVPGATLTPNPYLTAPDPDGGSTQTVVTMQTVLDQQPYIRDTFVNKTAFNPQTYADEFGLLQRYSSGSRIVVTYFLVSTPTSGFQRSAAIDQSTIRSPLQTSYTQINNFEIVMQQGFKSTFDEDSKETKVIGEALLYPGMRPRMGDMFVTPIGDSTFGIFRVTKVERLTYRQGSNHKISFFLNQYATQDEISILQESATSQLFFDQETYLGDTTTLLSSQSYTYLQTLRQMRGILIRYYYNTFYDKTMSSIMSPEGIYDPYLVNYLNGKISITESLYRPNQLYPGFQNYENSIWSRLTDITNRALINIQNSFDLVQYCATRWDISITSLINRTMVSLNNPNQTAMLQAQLALDQAQFPQPPFPAPPFPGFMPGDIYGQQNPLVYISTTQGYVFSENFYSGDKALMTPFEFLVSAAIYTRTMADVGDFITSYLNTYSLLTFDEQYYFIPIYIWLIDVAINSMAAPSSFMT